MTEKRDDLFSIPVASWADFVAKIAKLNKKAKRLGCEPVTWNVLEEKEVERSFDYKTDEGWRSKTYKVMAKVIELIGKAPRVEGFDFIARIEYLSDSKSKLFHCVPGADTKVDERFRDLDAGTCEHCKKARRRSDTFVVREVATGKQTQVGRQCLADFTGINTPEKIAGRCQWLSAFNSLRDEEERCWRSHFESTLDTQEVLALTSAYISRVGWVPRKAAEFSPGGSTASAVTEHFLPPPKDAGRVATLREIRNLSEQPEHQERARKVVEWIKGELADRAKSDYEINLVTLVAGELCERKHLGIVCSAVAAYQRAMNQKIEYAKKREALSGSGHLGEVGKRLKGLPVQIYQVRALEAGAWGPRALVKFLDDAGNLMTWFASGDRDYEVGAKVKINGTVKGHTEYQGVKETQLSRVAVL